MWEVVKDFADYGAVVGSEGRSTCLCGREGGALKQAKNYRLFCDHKVIGLLKGVPSPDAPDPA